MRQISSSSVSLRLATEPVVFATLEQIAREMARGALQKVIEQDVTEDVDAIELAPMNQTHRQVMHDLSGKRDVYLWADDIYFGCRLSDDRPCLLVLIV